MNEVSWSKKIPFFKNTTLLRSVILAYLAVVVIMSLIIIGIFMVDGDANKLGDVIFPFLAIYGFVFILLLFSTWIAIGNKYALRYTINKQGISITGTNDKSKNIRKIAISAGILTANPGVLGAGLLVKEDHIHLTWKDIKDIKWDTKNKKVILKSSNWNQVAIHYPSTRESDLKNKFNQFLENQ